MDSRDWSNGIRYHTFATRPDTEFKLVDDAAPHHRAVPAARRPFHCTVHTPCFMLWPQELTLDNAHGWAVHVDTIKTRVKIALVSHLEANLMSRSQSLLSMSTCAATARAPGGARGGGVQVVLVAGAYTRPPFWLNLSAFCGIGGACRGCLGGV